MDETGMTPADKIAYVDEVREIFGQEAADELAERIGLLPGSALTEAPPPGAGQGDGHGCYALGAAACGR